MKYKHEKASGGTKPMWLLWVLAAVLVVIIGGMLVKYVLPIAGDEAQNNAKKTKFLRIIMFLRMKTSLRKMKRQPKKNLHPAVMPKL